jgi:hypothetical protein
MAAARELAPSAPPLEPSVSPLALPADPAHELGAVDLALRERHRRRLGKISQELGLGKQN